jgi:hypothetical protein
VFIREPQKRETNGRNEEIAWKNQSDITWREIMRRDHLVDVTPSCSQLESRRGNQRSKSKWQTGSERDNARNANAETSKPYFCLKRAVLPADKYWRRPTEEHVEYEIHHVAYSYREQQVIGEECFGDRIDSKRLGFIQQRYSCREKAYDEKGEEVIAYQKKQKRRGFGFIHANDANSN